MAGVEDIRAGLHQSQEKADAVIALLQQAESDVDEALQALLIATQGSNQIEIQQAQSVFSEVSGNISDMQGRINTAKSSIETYSAGL